MCGSAGALTAVSRTYATDRQVEHQWPAHRHWLPSSTNSSRAVMPPARCRAASARYGDTRNTGCRLTPGCASRASRAASAGEGLCSLLGGRGGARAQALASDVTKRVGTGKRFPAKCPSCTPRCLVSRSGLASRVWFEVHALADRTALCYGEKQNASAVWAQHQSVTSMDMLTELARSGR